jgi:hypothetical protein
MNRASEHHDRFDRHTPQTARTAVIVDQTPVNSEMPPFPLNLAKVKRNLAAT